MPSNSPSHPSDLLSLGYILDQMLGPGQKVGNLEGPTSKQQRIQLGTYFSVGRKKDPHLLLGQSELSLD